MNLMSASMKEELMSEVEKNGHLLSVGDFLYYIDAANFEVWEVIHCDGFLSIKNDEEIIEGLDFDDLQHGWSIRSAARIAEMTLKNADNNSCFDLWVKPTDEDFNDFLQIRFPTYE